MKALELATYIRWKTRTNTTTFPNAEMLPLVKFRQDELARKLMDSLDTDEDIFLTPETANLVASATTRTYGFPSDILSRVKRVEAMFDGATWVRLVPMDMSEYRGTHDEATIANNFSNLQGEAKYDIQRRAIFIYSGTITAVTNGLKLWVFDYPALLTDLTENTLEIEDDPTDTTHGFPRELHELLARGVIIDYKESREKPIPLTERELSYEKDVNRAIAVLKHGDTNREILGLLPPASERGNDGSEY
jgi:hypothetical protein